MTIEEFKQLVKDEADNIKIHAKKSEIRKLSVRKLDPQSTYTCIYGMMTGSCFSERAIELLNLCTKPYSEDLCTGLISSLVDREKFPVPKTFLDTMPPSGRAFSPIECYIPTIFANNKNLIDYIKGKSEILVL